MRLTFRERHGPYREPGSQHPVEDGTGREFFTTILARTPIADGWAEYELEVSPEVETKSLRFVPKESNTAEQ
jgi:hypothetical protein